MAYFFDRPRIGYHIIGSRADPPGRIEFNNRYVSFGWTVQLVVAGTLSSKVEDEVEETGQRNNCVCNARFICILETVTILVMKHYTPDSPHV